MQIFVRIAVLLQLELERPKFGLILTNRRQGDEATTQEVLGGGDKELDQLSLGEKGTLLLILYLLIDKRAGPLVIDQPEGNLDGETVYSLLVPCIKEAKKTRQIFIVTHSPNLAVVCDAEQIIYASMIKEEANHIIEYESGAVENPMINAHVCDVLEGTMPVFRNRDLKYQESS